MEQNEWKEINEINCFWENYGGEWMEREAGRDEDLSRGRIGEYGDKVYRIMEIQKHKVDWLSK